MEKRPLNGEILKFSFSVIYTDMECIAKLSEYWYLNGRERIHSILYVSQNIPHGAMFNAVFINSMGFCLFRLCLVFVHILGWWHSIVVRTSVLVGELSLSWARLMDGCLTTLWVKRSLSVNQQGHLSLPFLRGRLNG